MCHGDPSRNQGKIEMSETKNIEDISDNDQLFEVALAMAETAGLKEAESDKLRAAWERQADAQPGGHKIRDAIEALEEIVGPNQLRDDVAVVLTALADKVERLEAEQAALRKHLCADAQPQEPGWVLHTSSVALREILPLVPGGARVMAWVKGFAAFKPTGRSCRTSRRW